jgi:L-ascorbate metabolism protein UlaG (beta-lactamase superfamily)
MKLLLAGVGAVLGVAGAGIAEGFETDVFDTDAGRLEITFIGHGTLMFRFKDLVIHVDPVSREADYSELPEADLILVTHEHRDHLDAAAIAEISKSNTVLLGNGAAVDQLGSGTAMANGATETVLGIRIEAVPAYNTSPGRTQFHPKGRDNGYILSFGKTRVYVAGDTEDTPEMKALTDIGIAFLPMNQPYTMTPEQVAGAARAFAPEFLYPYHYGDTNPQELVDRLADRDDIEVRIRKLD